MEREIEVMCIIRVPPRGKLVVQIGDDRYKTLAEVPQAAMQQRILAAIGELITFVDGYQKLVDAGLAPPAAPPPARSRKATGELNQQQAEFLRSLERGEFTPAESPSPPGLLRRPARSAPPPELSKQANIAAQINAILDRLLAENPQFAGKNIKLHAPDGASLQIEVDGRFYQNPNQIDDQAARAIIKRALQEWDKS